MKLYKTLSNDRKLNYFNCLHQRGLKIELLTWTFSTFCLFYFWSCDSVEKVEEMWINKCYLHSLSLNSWGSLPVWPDLAKCHHFGKKIEMFGNIFKLYFIFGEVLNPLWHNFYAFGQCWKWPNIKKQVGHLVTLVPPPFKVLSFFLVSGFLALREIWLLLGVLWRSPWN